MATLRHSPDGIFTSLAFAVLVYVLLPFPLALSQETAPGDWYLQAIQMPRQLEANESADPIVIAVVDDGMRISHQDLADFIWTNPNEIPFNRIDDDGNGMVDDVYGWDVSDADADVSPPRDRTDFYHGTHIAGILTKMLREAYGEAATELVRIMPVKTLSDGAATTYLIDAFEGIRYAMDAGADIILCSWGVAQITREQSEILQQAAERGILIIASGGNLPEEREQYPAAHDSVLAVASTDRNGQKTKLSNYGEFIDISAPGEAIQGAAISADDAYETRDGSSFSTPMVAATAALLKLQHPDYSNLDIVACLKSASVPISIENRLYSAKLGAGILNVTAAVACDFLESETTASNELPHPEGFIRASGSGRDSISWTIRPQGEFAGLRFTPVINRETRARGRIEFRADDSPNAELIASHSLDALPPSIFVPGMVAHITFVSESRRRFDWMLEYEAETIDFSRLYCSGTIEFNSEGILSDGSGSENYSENSNCMWLITAPEGKVIVFHFDELDTEANVDSIYFFDGARTNADIIATYSGNQLPAEFVEFSSRRNQVLVWFVTDGQNQGQGWQASYSFQDP